jgi:hypothetical protein
MVAREVGLIYGGPEVDLRGVGFSRVNFGGVPAVPAPTPNRPDADPERDDNEGVKAPNIAVRARNRTRRTPDVSDDQVPNHVTAWSRGLIAASFIALTLLRIFFSDLHDEGQRYPRRT